MKRVLGKILISLGAVLVCLALLLLIYNQKESKEAGEASGAVLEQLKAVEESEDTLIDPETGLPPAEMKSVLIDGNEYIGYLSIPALGLELPVMSDWSYEKLTIAPCREVGTVHTKDMVIAAHNYVNHFGNLKQLVQGDIVVFIDLNKIRTTYTVEMIEILRPDQVEEMRSGEWDLTLYTCTYSGATRVTVRCREIQ